MIKIQLKNFRIFQSAEFTFDENFCLISGKSGRGKSTIFMAIMFAITGEGKKLQRLGGKSCSVTLTTDVMKITRTKGPNTVHVHYEGKDYEKADAQALIDKHFDQYSIGYVTQNDGNKFFITMSPNDKIKFIEKMAFGEENVDNLVAKCKNLIKERKTEMMLTTKQRETTEDMLNSLKIKKRDVDDETTEEEYEKQIQTKKQKMEKLKTKLNQTQNLIKMKETAEQKLDAIPQVEQSLETLDEELQKITSHKTSWEKYQRAMKNLGTHSDIPESELETKIDNLKKIINLESQTQDFDKVKSTISDLEKKIKTSMIHMKCPSCKTKVAMWCNKLIIPEEDSKSSKTGKVLTVDESKTIEEKLLNQKVKLKEIETKRQELKELKDARDDSEGCIKSCIRGCANGCLKRELEKLLKIKEDDAKYFKQKTICDSLKTEKPEYPSNAEKKIKEQQKHIYERKEKENTLSEIKIKHDPDDLYNDISKLEKFIDQLSEDKEGVKSAKYWKMVESLLEKESELNVIYPKSVKLLEIIKEAEKLAIEKVIDEINLHAQIYIDNFFSSSNLNVRLVFDGVKLTVNVNNNGFETDLYCLSGGEFARVNLAFTIAIAEINHSRILLLDECIASLDQETTEDVVNTIKLNFKGMVLFIAHQTTLGVFDKVIEL
ncbi:116L [Cherax quadricarinatus iridovirus]|uniref:DNA double-strand break repair rad50 ATPase-like protein n=1 Tax=Shrimp hemocyte iridescent virus TaxID=2039780 RepID=A0A291B0M7_9VIRU|nr:116L [Cherax quadricarinatus iridovirus]YP_010084790.1 DNA double-strand break repair rad50 ATPase-like protein [Shrimp hemocyte iridescent virus]UPA43426.1 DNA double-strand break repair rad50 ATPase-like protein [Iridovirus CN01]ASZ85096.1 116L [Cherax quadricarinatus iridovirus]ATE87047.1 DNA double-strand break repair rad50 ATPase-like protein [Shrimp hemocyte iridescent virus]UPA43502.1 DNA double-strand break repair rad50 ATPase-like protein [Iridovirus CN01]UPA43698.1 DNA double-str